MKFNQWFIDGIYNYIPEEMQKEQKDLCRFCYYRSYKLKLELADYESQIKGGAAEDYLDLSIKLYKTEINERCKEKGCLLYKLNSNRKVVLCYREETLLNNQDLNDLNIKRGEK